MSTSIYNSHLGWCYKGHKEQGWWCNRDKEDGDATYTMGRCQRIIKPHVNMAKLLNLSKSTKSDWIEGASMTEMQWTP